MILVMAIKKNNNKPLFQKGEKNVTQASLSLPFEENEALFTNFKSCLCPLWGLTCETACVKEHIIFSFLQAI